MTQLLQLNVENLAELQGGRVKLALENEIRRAVADCEDRASDNTEREVHLVMKFKPVVDDRGGLEQVLGQFFVKGKVPVRKTKPISFSARKSARGPMLVWSEDSPDNVDQMTISDIVDTEGTARRDPPVK